MQPILRLSIMELKIVVIVLASCYLKFVKTSETQKIVKAISLEEPSFLTSENKLAFIKMGFSYTHNRDLLAIVKVFKIWNHYLEDCKYKVSVLLKHQSSINEI